MTYLLVCRMKANVLNQFYKSKINMGITENKYNKIVSRYIIESHGLSNK